MKYLARFIMWLAGWKYKGELPAEKKAVIISVPHTSNWDFFWGELAFLSRKKRKKWKKGFLVIAKAAGVPVYLGRIDYKGKYCEVGPLFYPTEDVDADLAYIMSTYHDANPKYPENFSNGN